MRNSRILGFHGAADGSTRRRQARSRYRRAGRSCAQTLKYELEQRGIGAGAVAHNCIGYDDLDKACRTIQNEYPVAFNICTTTSSHQLVQFCRFAGPDTGRGPLATHAKRGVRIDRRTGSIEEIIAPEAPSLWRLLRVLLATLGLVTFFIAATILLINQPARRPPEH